ncbi:hypothetical protein [Aurantibacillus circumpalustris]|uniref:hypothetical protein n=1 Tax=Aurantibacillus circumpalustris TaxID=3036359 RepID=UPI00295B8503|nr:hypothetical protein [Aurantibacillus circumpalustris]
MKKSILALSLTVILFSCKKDEPKEFTATDVTGTTLVKGTITKNIITPNGSGNWTNGSRIPVKGINVSIKVNKNSLYPNSTAQGADVYSATTDSTGNYQISVKSNATGVSAQITIDGYSGTLDTLINGVTKRGFYSTFAGTNQNRTLFMGQNSVFNYDFFANNVSSNPNTIKIGSATITGSVAVNLFKQVLTGTVVSITTTNVPLASHKVYLTFDKDPSTLANKSYETTTDANGNYSFNVATVPSGTSGFNQNATIWVADYAATRDTIMSNSTVKPGKMGVFQMQTLNQNGVFNSNIRNANHFSYNSFIAD